MKKIVFWIVSLHLLILTFPLLKLPKKTEKIPRPIAVRTIQQKPPLPKKTTPKPVKPAKPPPVVKQVKSVPVLQKTLSEARSILQSMKEAKSDVKPEKISLPKKIEHLDAEQKIENYREILIEHLRAHLELPEYGEVKLSFSLDFHGKVTKVEVLESESPTNQTYLEDHLKDLQFPPFSESALNKKEKTFILTFCNKV